MGKKVLVVDDDKNVLKLVEVIFISAGYSVLMAESGSEAIIKAKNEKPDIILLDIIMPGKDGIETLAELKNSPETEKIPVIMITGEQSLNKIEQCLTAGADDYILKPFGKNVILAKVRELLK